MNQTPTASQPGFLLPLAVPAKTAYNKSIKSRRRGRCTGRRRRGSMIKRDKLKPLIEKYKALQAWRLIVSLSGRIKAPGIFPGASTSIIYILDCSYFGDTLLYRGYIQIQKIEEVSIQPQWQDCICEKCTNSHREWQSIFVYNIFKNDC